jgi:hypothetical protein
MATFNGERFLAEQLASLAGQTALPRELVIVDDGSTDATITIAEKFATSAPFPVRTVRNESSLGHGETFFRALAGCSGDLVAFCDQDDVWHTDKLAACVAVFENTPGVSLLVHAGRVVDEELRPTRVRIPDIRRSRVVVGEKLSPWFVHRGFAMVIPRWLRDIAAVAERPPAFRRVEYRLMDHDEWACFLAPAVGSVALVAQELAFHRRHGGNFSILEAPGMPVPGAFRRTRRTDANLTVLRPALGGDRGLAGLFDVDTKIGAYRNVAQQCREAALFLERLARQPEKPAPLVDAKRVGARAALYSHAGDVLESRADAVDAARPRSARLGRVSRLALSGRYGRRSKGGLGPLSFPLDVVVSLVGRTERSSA